MENILFDTWIELGSGRSGFLKISRKTDDENMVLLLVEKTGAVEAPDTTIRTIQLILRGRKVTSENGILVDFGDAYPLATPQGKITITKQFMRAFLG